MKIKLSRSQWELIGKTAGWMKTAQYRTEKEDSTSDPGSAYIQNKELEPTSFGRPYVPELRQVLAIVSDATDPKQMARNLHNNFDWKQFLNDQNNKNQLKKAIIDKLKTFPQRISNLSGYESTPEDDFMVACSVFELQNLAQEIRSDIRKGVKGI